ncbi:MAG TPA: DUF86 domain-containing protein [Bryobacteraceae bacterium]
MKTDRIYLLHIRDAVLRIEEYAAVGKEEFLAKSHWQDAIIRQLEIIGEASKRLSPSLRDAAPEVPWRRICGLRDVLIHNYVAVDLEAVWSVVESGIPLLKTTVETALSRDE